MYKETNEQVGFWKWANEKFTKLPDGGMKRIASDEIISINEAGGEYLEDYLLNLKK